MVRPPRNASEELRIESGPALGSVGAGSQK